MNKSKIVKWVIASPFILIGVGVAFCEINKAYWDHQVKLMCEKDGGVTVFEKVELTTEERAHLKIAPSKKYSSNEYNYFLEDKTEIINDKFPIVRKAITLIYRNVDNQIIGQQVYYSRVGGDFPNGIGHHSSYNCDMAGVSTDFNKTIFVTKGE